MLRQIYSLATTFTTEIGERPSETEPKRPGKARTRGARRCRIDGQARREPRREIRRLKERKQEQSQIHHTARSRPSTDFREGSREGRWEAAEREIGTLHRIYDTIRYVTMMNRLIGRAEVDTDTPDNTGVWPRSRSAADLMDDSREGR